MKALLIVVLILIIIGGFFGFQAMSGKKQDNPAVSNEQVKLTGVVKKATGDDYSHLLLTGNKTVGLASYSVKLDDYIDKKVEASGQYSGTTLYADKVVVLSE